MNDLRELTLTVASLGESRTTTYRNNLQTMTLLPGSHASAANARAHPRALSTTASYVLIGTLFGFGAGRYSSVATSLLARWRAISTIPS